MDAKDLELITLLGQNGRRDTSDLSEGLGISPNNVERRIRLLLREGQLKGFSAFFDRRSFGYDTTYLKLHFDMRSMDRVIDGVSRMPQITLVYPNMDDFMWVEVVHWDSVSLKAAIREMERIASPNTVTAHMTPRFSEEVPSPPKGKDLQVLKLLVKDGRVDPSTMAKLMDSDEESIGGHIVKLMNVHGVNVKPIVQEDMITAYPAFSVILELKKGCRLDSCFFDLKNISKGSWDIIPLEKPSGMWMRFFGRDLHAMDMMLERYRRQPNVKDVTVILPDTMVVKRSVDINILSGHVEKR
ncbi:MAG: AsnC family transcriptional regulator [Candidatus Thermoplasmatota archaeon]|nr:AsnC family transcriptional regulator [Candidatus Thermoplasmatota archaeon]